MVVVLVLVLYAIVGVFGLWWPPWLMRRFAPSERASVVWLRRVGTLMLVLAWFWLLFDLSFVYRLVEQTEPSARVLSLSFGLGATTYGVYPVPGFLMHLVATILARHGRQ